MMFYVGLYVCCSCTVLQGIMLCALVVYFIVSCIVFYCVGSCCIVLYCIGLHCIVLYCIVSIAFGKPAGHVVAPREFVHSRWKPARGQKRKEGQERRMRRIRRIRKEDEHRRKPEAASVARFAVTTY